MAAVKGIDPAPFNKKEWGLIISGMALGVLGFLAPAPFDGVLFATGLFSTYMAFCGFHVLMVDPITGTCHKKNRENVPKYFVIISSIILLTLIVLCAIM